MHIANLSIVYEYTIVRLSFERSRKPGNGILDEDEPGAAVLANRRLTRACKNQIWLCPLDESMQESVNPTQKPSSSTIRWEQPVLE